MRILSTLVLLLALAGLGAACTRNDTNTAQSAAAPAATCVHGVKQGLCARCNPKLEAVFKAKGDWCEEHRRPESQCVLCKPALAKEGIK